MFRIIAVLIEDDPRAIERIAPHVLAMQDIGTYTSEAHGTDALVNLIEEHNVDWPIYEAGVLAAADVIDPYQLANASIGRMLTDRGLAR